MTAIIEQYYGTNDAGELLVGGLSVTNLVSKYGSPFFVYDSSVLDKKWRMLRDTLPARFDIHYSVKANPNQAIIKHLLAKGAGVEVASAGEIYQALQAGCEPSKILFAGPGKSEDELRFALQAGIKEIHVESLLELDRIDRLAQELNHTAKIGVRINPDEQVEGAAMLMGGRPLPFGIDESQLDDFVRRLHRSSNVRLTGIHMFVGTQILDSCALVDQYRNAVRLAKKIATRLQRPLETIDFGGGLGVPYYAHETALSLAGFRTGLIELEKTLSDEPLLADAICVVEPGRFLVAEAGIYVSKVTDIKISKGKKFLIVDGGMHHHLAASGNLGQTIKRNYPIAMVNKVTAPRTETVEVVGPLCTPLDVLGRSLELPEAEVGDLIGVFQSGAYARASSPLGFLSHCSPAEVLVSSGGERVIRERGCFEDFLRDQPQATPSGVPAVLPRPDLIAPFTNAQV